MAQLFFDPNKLDANDRSIYEAMVEKRKKQGAPFGGPYAALMNHPELCQKIEALGYYLKFKGHLPRDVYQFVVLAVARETKADFEWKDHLQHALAAGLPLEVIDTIHERGIINQTFSEPYQIAAQILSATLIWQNIPQQVQDSAIQKYGMYGFVEIVVLSGFYQMFSAINQGFNIS